MAPVSFVLFLLTGLRGQEASSPTGRWREVRDAVTTVAETIALRLDGLSHSMAPPLLCDLGCDVSPLLYPCLWISIVPELAGGEWATELGLGPLHGKDADGAGTECLLEGTWIPAFLSLFWIDPH